MVTHYFRGALIMFKILTQAIFVFCLCLCTFVPEKIAAKSKIVDPAAMQKHVEEVKRKNPAKYQAMVQEAGGNITTCASCHKANDAQAKQTGTNLR